MQAHIIKDFAALRVQYNNSNRSMERYNSIVLMVTVEIS